MATGPTYRVDYRRKREQKTSYKNRMKILKSGLPRLVVRPSNKHLLVQLVEYREDGDVVAVTVKSTKLKEYGWKYATGNLPAAYLTGLLCGIAARKKNIAEAILDLGMNTSVHGSRIYAALKGALDGGLKISHDVKMLPPEDRIKGVHIASYVQKSKDMSSDVLKVKETIENESRK
jgi:large subunit ribosomal protein L18